MGTTNSVVATIMKQMPEHAEYYVTEVSGDSKLSIHWKLNNDPNRPNKYSKTIVITIPQELIEDFPAYHHDLQELAMNKIGQHIQNCLKSFNPDHNSQRGRPEPIENWDLAIERLFG